MHRYIAQSTGGVSVGGQIIESPLRAHDGTRITSIAQLINTVMPMVIIVCGVILFFVFVWGGYDFMLSRGNPEKIKAGRAKITYGIVGFIMLVMTFFIVNLITYIFGIGKGVFN